MKDKKEKNSKEKKQVKFYFVKSLKERPINDSEILINGKTIVFIVCSIISAFINLVFITNLTKSPYGIGTLLSIPGAVLLGLLSIGLDLSKCLHAIQVNTLNELHRKLSGYEWADNIKKVSRKWFTVYILYVILSIITSVSLSSISIGAGITRNANAIKQIGEFITQGEQYSGIDTAAKDITKQNLIAKATDTSEQDAILFVNSQVSNVWPKIQEWQDEYTDFINSGLDTNDKTILEELYSGAYSNKTFKSYYDYWFARDNDINALLSSSKYSTERLTERQIRNLTQAKFEAAVKNNYLATFKTAATDEATKKLNELTDTTMDEAYGWICTLNSVGLVNPKTGETVVFDTDQTKSTKVLVQSALTILKALKVDVENDSGDIGSSSKIFMQLGSTIENAKANKNKSDDLGKSLNDALKVKAAGSFGATEIMMMSMLLFLSLLCELAINQFSPKTKISRKTLSQFSQYLPPDFDINNFMLSVYLDQYQVGEISREEFFSNVEDTLQMMGISKDNLLGRLPFYEDIPLKGGKKAKQTKEVKTENKEPKVVKEEIKEEPKVEVKEEIKEEIVNESPEVNITKRTPVEETPNETGYSDAVDNLVSEIEEMLK